MKKPLGLRPAASEIQLCTSWGVGRCPHNPVISQGFPLVNTGGVSVDDNVYHHGNPFACAFSI